jgi:peroxiredoxin
MTDISEPGVGVKAIDFSLSASTGIQISLANYLPKSHVYLFFVREFN